MLAWPLQCPWPLQRPCPRTCRRAEGSRVRAREEERRIVQLPFDPDERSPLRPDTAPTSMSRTIMTQWTWEIHGRDPLRYVVPTNDNATIGESWLQKKRRLLRIRRDRHARCFFSACRPGKTSLHSGYKSCFAARDHTGEHSAEDPNATFKAQLFIQPASCDVHIPPSRRRKHSTRR
jgi:hypothetical protein